MTSSNSVDINTVRGPMHFYIYSIPPIPGTGMIKNKDIVIVETDTKRYCNFVGDKVYDFQNYGFKFNKYSANFRLISDTLQKKTDKFLLEHPALRTNPFNVTMNNKYAIPMMIIDYISCPSHVYDNLNKTRAQSGTCAQIIDMDSYKKIIVEFKIIMYEYEDINTNLKIDSEKDIINNTNLVQTLIKILLIEQGMVFLDKQSSAFDSLEIKKETIEENILNLQKKYDILKESIPQCHRCCICFCYTNKNSVCVPCGHTQYCDKCFEEIKTCQLCKKDVISVVKLLSSNQ